MTINPALVIVPVVGGMLTLLIFGWRREMAQRKHKRERLDRIKTARIPEGAAYIAGTSTVQQVREDLIGSYMLIGVGTFGLNQLCRLLILMYRCGLEQLVGSILAIENDSQMRITFHQHVPAIFHDRVVYAYSEAFNGGMRNRSIPWVLERIDLWGVPICKATHEVIDLHLRRNHSRSPSGIFTFLSLGGQAPLGLPALEILNERFEESLTAGFTALPRHIRLRERFAEVKPAYEKQGLHGWLLTDNLGRDPVTSDYGMVAMITALTGSALYADQGTQPNNALALAFTQQPGAILVYQTLAAEVVGYPFAPDPSMPPHYYVFQQPVTEQVLKGLRRITEGRGIWSADLPIGENGTSTFDVVMVSLRPEDLQKIEDDVKAGLRLRNQTHSRNGHGPNGKIQYGQPDYELSFASIATVIDQSRPACPVIAVRLAAVRNGAQTVGDIIKPPQVRMLANPQTGRSLGARTSAATHQAVERRQP